MSASNNSEHQKSLLSRVFQQPRLEADNDFSRLKRQLLSLKQTYTVTHVEIRITS